MMTRSLPPPTSSRDAGPRVVGWLFLISGLSPVLAGVPQLAELIWNHTITVWQQISN